MSKTSTAGWREARRKSARDAIVDAAWELVHEQGLAALSLRDLAGRAGITTPTVYAYFDSKNAIYDAMFGRAATEFADHMAQRYDEAEPVAALTASVQRFAKFCTDDVARYQLLFQRVIPEFEPSAESYAPAVRALDGARELLARVGVVEPQHLDLYTALVTGLVDQQVSNDPGGDRWTRLIEDATSMFVAHCQSPSPPTTLKQKPIRGVRS